MTEEKYKLSLLKQILTVYYWNSAPEKRNGCCPEDIAIKKSNINMLGSILDMHISRRESSPW